MQIGVDSMRIGLRNIKTAIAVLICLITNVILVAFLGKETAFNWYTPFFAGIAACYSLQSDIQKSLRQAKIRSVGSIIGGILGMCVLLLFETYLSPLAIRCGGDSLALLLQYFLVALGIIIVIHVTVLTKQTDATFITCLTYLSVTISIRNGGLPVVIFAINRILSTLYGVLIAIFVNLVNILPFSYHRRKDILCICGYDNCLSYKNKLDGYTKYTINRLLFLGANITASTINEPANLHILSENIKLKLPVIVMHGAALYDFKTKTYSNIINFNIEIARTIEKIIKDHRCNYIANTIIDNVHQIFITDLSNDAEINYFNEIKNNSLINYTKTNPSENTEIVYYKVLNKTEIIDELIFKLKEEKVCCIKCKDKQYKNYSLLYIYDKRILECAYLYDHPAFKNKEIFVVGNTSCEEIIMKKANHSFCNYNAKASIIESTTNYINSKNNHKLIKKVKWLFHQKKR